MRTDSKVSLLCDQIRQMALELEPGAQLPTVNQLCSQLETSRVTLTEVLKQLEQQKVIYRQQGKGIFVSPHLHRKNIGILFDSSFFLTNGSSPFWGTLWGLLAREALLREERDSLYHCFYTSFRSERGIRLPEDFRQMVDRNRLDGLIIIGLFEQEVRWIEQKGIPCVSFAGPSSWMVNIDTIGFIRLAVRELAERHCHRVEIWLAPFNDPELADLFSHLQADRALIFDSVQVKVGQDGLTLQEQGYHIAMDTFSQNREQTPDGIIVFDDLMTTGVLAAFQVLGIHLGKEIWLVSHANTNSMTFLNAVPGITVLESDPGEIVSTLFQLLDLLLSGQTPAETHTKIPFRPTPEDRHLSDQRTGVL